jgi:hypothetical protein
VDINSIIRVCYSEITPESAEDGDTSDSGLVGEVDGFDALEEAVIYVINQGAYFFSGSDYYEYGWYCTGHQVVSYETLTEREETFHLGEGFTPEDKLIFYHLFMLATRSVKDA